MRACIVDPGGVKTVLFKAIFLFSIPWVCPAQKVGIGNSSPQKSLHISGEIRLDTLAIPQLPGLIRHNSLGDISSLSFPGNTAVFLAGDGNWLVPPAPPALPAGTIVISTAHPNQALIDAGYEFFGRSTLDVGDVDSIATTSANQWAALPLTGARPSSEQVSMIWGGTRFFAYTNYPLYQYYMYMPATNTWQAVPYIPNISNAIFGHSIVWTGTEMIVWGGVTEYEGLKPNGYRYNPNTNQWTAISTVNAPAARRNHFAVWTGTEMIIWGGQNNQGEYFNTGARYNPANNTWTAMSTTNAPVGRTVTDGFQLIQNPCVWTGTEFIFWGGMNDLSNALNDGGRYNPNSNTWTTMAVPAANTLTGRNGHSLVWTGQDVIVWGGKDENLATLGDGAAYRPSNNSWFKISGTNAPAPRHGHAAAWTGTQMIIIGGSGGGTGALYSRSGDAWSPMAPLNVIPTRSLGPYFNNTVWSGTELYTWGEGLFGPSNTGAQYFTTSKTVTLPGQKRTYFLYRKK